MQRRQCYHCKQWIDEAQAHDCSKTTEAALTKNLTEDLRDAWRRVRETAAGFGEQRIYASHHSIMFSRQSCYFFVRPKRTFIEVCVFLGREVKAPQVRRSARASKTKIVHTIQITHRDEVEAPLTDWMREAYEFSTELAPKAAPSPKRRARTADNSPGELEGRKSPRTSAPTKQRTLRQRPATKQPS